MKKRYLTPMKVATIAVVVLIFIFTTLPLTVMADQKQGNKEMEGGERAIQLPQKTVSIEKKTIEAVITNSGDRFKLSDETIITGLNGKQVSIREMLVPCDAQITYKSAQGKRIAQRIKMLSVASDSSWHWNSDTPE